MNVPPRRRGAGVWAGAAGGRGCRRVPDCARRVAETPRRPPGGARDAVCLYGGGRCPRSGRQGAQRAPSPPLGGCFRAPRGAGRRRNARATRRLGGPWGCSGAAGRGGWKWMAGGLRRARRDPGAERVGGVPMCATRVRSPRRVAESGVGGEGGGGRGWEAASATGRRLGAVASVGSGVWPAGGESEIRATQRGERRGERRAATLDGRGGAWDTVADVGGPLVVAAGAGSRRGGNGPVDHGSGDGPQPGAAGAAANVQPGFLQAPPQPGGLAEPGQLRSGPGSPPGCSPG